MGYRVLDTTALAEGQHTIAWVVTDSQGAANGIGSRYFSVANSADAQALALTGAVTSSEIPETPVAEPVVSTAATSIVAGPDRGRHAASLTDRARRRRARDRAARAKRRRAGCNRAMTENAR